MRLNKINELIEKKEQLTEKEKEELKQGILTNKKARETAINGAIFMGNLNLAVHLLTIK